MIFVFYLFDDTVKLLLFLILSILQHYNSLGRYFAKTAAMLQFTMN